MRCAVKMRIRLLTDRFCTFVNSAELVERLEAGGVVDVVGMESDTEEVAVGADRRPGKVTRRAAVTRHLAVHQVHVEVGKLDVVALRRFVATAPA